MTSSENDPDFQLPFRIELAEVPPPVVKRASADLSPDPFPPPPEPLPAVLGLATAEAEEHPSWHTVKKEVGRGFFNPFAAFEDGVDWERFKRSQVFLVVTSLIGPFLALLVMDFIAALLYQALAALQSRTPPNPFYELALYPAAYLVVKGYWITYLILPLAVFILGWLWAAGTAWNLARDSEEDFSRLFCVLAMLGAMFAPFTMFPFIRLLVFGFLTVFVAKKIGQHSSVSFLQLVKRGGILLVGLIVLYTWFERKVESYYPEPSELTANLNAFLKSNKKLEWPRFRTPESVSPFQAILNNVNSLDTETREKGMRSAIDILHSGLSTPEARFSLGLRLAELGNGEGQLFVAKAYQAGRGVPADSGKALAWMKEVVKANPANLGYGLTLASLYIQDKRALEGKRLFVALAKTNVRDLETIVRFLEKEELDHPEPALIWEIKNLYSNPDGIFSEPETPCYGGGRYGSGRYDDATAMRQNLLARLAGLDQQGSQWFFRALLTEFGNSARARAEIYGEIPVDDLSAEALSAIPQDDPVALGDAGDRLFDKGDAVKAREYWLKAASALRSDSRGPNGRLYFKLAASHDAVRYPNPATRPSANPREAVRYYLSFLLVSLNPGSEGILAMEALKRLGTPVAQDVNPRSSQYIALCVKYDVPEAWVMLGCDHMGDTPNHLPKNLAKARDCFQKAKSLGYQGPAVHMLDKAGN